MTNQTKDKEDQMNLQIKITVEIADNWYELTHNQDVDIEEWDIEGVACEAIEALSFRMKSALNPCFWDHAVMEYNSKRALLDEDN